MGAECRLAHARRRTGIFNPAKARPNSKEILFHNAISLRSFRHISVTRQPDGPGRPYYPSRFFKQNWGSEPSPKLPPLTPEGLWLRPRALSRAGNCLTGTRRPEGTIPRQVMVTRKRQHLLRCCHFWQHRRQSRSWKGSLR